MLLPEYAYQHARLSPSRVYLTQPAGGTRVVDYTWQEVVEQARRMAGHLAGLGLPRGARVGIISKNCAHFIIAELAIWFAGYTTVAIFPTETASTVRFVLEHSEAQLLFVGKLDDWSSQQGGVPEGLPCIALPLAANTGLPTWDALSHAATPLAEPVQRTADELAMVIYTSGSTGKPKGVMVSFGAISAAGEHAYAYLRGQVGGGVPWRVLSYLPLAHSFERTWIEATTLVSGEARVYFAERLDTFIDDLKRARPTLFISVPRLWLKFREGVLAKMPAHVVDRVLALPLLGSAFGRFVLRGLGLDHVVLAGSGSAPIPAELIAWYRRLGLRLVEGYGMTEDSSYSHMSAAHDHEAGYVGRALPGVSVRISADGEVQVRSPGALSGYFKEPQLTAEAFTEDGFFRTGDRGELRADGLLKLTGRTKELFKTAKGKYIAPAPIENQLNAHPYVEQSMVTGVGRPAAVALVQLAESLRPRVGADDVRRSVEVELGRLLDEINASLADYSQLRMLVVAREPWTIENGCLTPTMKIKRARIEEAVAAALDDWYARPGSVLWA
jgi:long-chain acyl-CoA synthetase